MRLIINVVGWISSFPARIKGAKIQMGSILYPGYDFLFVSMRNVFIGRNVLIGRRAWVQTVDGGRITIGNGCNIGRDVVISAASEVIIGDRCLMSYRVSILDHNHNFKKRDYLTSGIDHPKPIKIGKGCFVGANSFLLKGVELGDYCVVGANAVVTKSFPEKSIIGGNPARLIGHVVHD